MKQIVDGVMDTFERLVMVIFILAATVLVLIGVGLWWLV